MKINDILYKCILDTTETDHKILKGIVTKCGERRATIKDQFEINHYVTPASPSMEGWAESEKDAKLLLKASLEADEKDLHRKIHNKKAAIQNIEKDLV